LNPKQKGEVKWFAEETWFNDSFKMYSASLDTNGTQLPLYPNPPPYSCWAPVLAVLLPFTEEKTGKSDCFISDKVGGDEYRESFE
jgi:hypothetical protein